MDLMSCMSRPAGASSEVSLFLLCRWVVVMPRFPSPVAPPGTESLVRTLMVAYKGRDQCVPSCKVWLDGAGELSPSCSDESSSA